MKQSHKVRYTKAARFFLATTTVIISFVSCRTDAAPARFWFSLSDTETNGPEVPTLNLEQGTTQPIYVWSRPQTKIVEENEVLQNMRNLSLNLTSMGTSNVFDIEDDFQIFNPGSRFELVRDSDTPSDNPIASTNGPNDSVLGISAGIAQTTVFSGIGLGSGDNTCTDGVACDPAWLVAQFNLTGLTDTGSSELRLQVGSLGINHDGEFSDFTEVIFGEDQPGPIYNAKTNRNHTFSEDTADLILNAIPVVTGDYNADGSVNGADFLAWQRGDSPRPLSSEDLAAWTTNYGTAAPVLATSSAAVPEPSSLILGICGLLLTLNSDQHRKSRLLDC